MWHNLYTLILIFLLKTYLCSVTNSMKDSITPSFSQIEDSYTSIQGLTLLVNVENKLLYYLQQNKKELYEINKDFEHDLILWVQEHNIAIEDPEKYVSNPITCFQLIKRLTVYWFDVRDSVIQYASQNFTDIIETEVESLLPTMNDLKGAVFGISFLCSVYQLPFSKFMKGEFMNKHYDVSLSVNDVLEMMYLTTSYSNIQNAYLLAVELLYRDDFTSNTLQKHMDLFSDIVVSLNTTGEYKLSQKLSRLSFKKFNNFTLPKKPNREFQNDFITKKMQNFGLEPNNNNDKRKSTPNEVKENQLQVIEDFKYFSSLCREPTLSKSYLNKNLTCKYKNDNHFLKIAPMKLEILNIKPLVYLFHDVMSDREIKKLKDYALPYMQRAVVVNYDEEKQKQQGQNFSDSRISETAWLHEGEDEDMDDMIDVLTLRMNDMTSKEIVLSESLQVNNYGLGGYFAPHFDALHYDKALLRPNNRDNREATIMFYMSDVELGGATVFLDLQLSVQPQKGTALFWYNLNPDRSVDIDTLHGACPVLVGNKWVCNKWVHRFNSEPYCELNSEVYNAENS